MTHYVLDDPTTDSRPPVARLRPLGPVLGILLGSAVLVILRILVRTPAGSGS